MKFSVTNGVGAFLLSCLLLPLMAANASEKLLIVEEGEPRAVVVLADRDPATEGQPGWRVPTEAWKILTENLQQMSGAKLKTYRESDLGKVSLVDGKIISEKVDAEAFILIGESGLSEMLGINTDGLSPGGMVAKTTPNAVVLLGTFDGEVGLGGTVYATTMLLEELGCRYLWPGELGKVVPRQTTVRVPAMDVRFSPPIRQRQIRMEYGSDRVTRGAAALGYEKGVREEKLKEAWTPKAYSPSRGGGGWAGWNRLGGSVNIRGGHAFGSLYDEQHKEHPGWFALQPDGTRNQVTPKRARMCISNSELIDFIAKGLVDQVNANPLMTSVSLSPNDGGSDLFCMCKTNALGEPGCATLDPANSPQLKRPIANVTHSLTDRYVLFWNQIAERVCKVHPDLLFTIDAYSVYTSSPVQRKLHPNMIVRFAFKLYSAEHRQWWEEWSAMANQIYWRPNNLYGPCREGVVEFNREYATSMKFAASHSAVATDIDSILHYWSTQGLNYYVMSKVIWDPDADVDVIIDDYCESGFGEGAGHVREYFRQVEALTDKKYKLSRDIAFTPGKQIVHYRIDSTAQVFTEEAVSQLRDQLESARLAAKDPVALERIAFLRVGLEFTDLQVQILRILIDQKQGNSIDLAAAADLYNKRRALMREIFEKQHLAVNVGYVEYMNEGFFRPLVQALKEQPQ